MALFPPPLYTGLVETQETEELQKTHSGNIATRGINFHSRDEPVITEPERSRWVPKSLELRREVAPSYRSDYTWAVGIGKIGNRVGPIGQDMPDWPPPNRIVSCRAQKGQKNGPGNRIGPKMDPIR